MAQVQANGITIEYELAGPADGPVLLMIHGVGAQMIRWPQALLDSLQAAGFRTLVFDNRDIGLSTHIDAPIPDLNAALSARVRGEEPDLPYNLSDMAADTAGLLAALDIASAHVMGVSLGGMIAQQLAIEHRERVRSLTIVMSQSGNPDMPPSKPEAIAILSNRPPDYQADLEGYLRHQVELNRTVGSPAYPVPEADIRDFAQRAANRAWNPAGTARQLVAGRASADRREQLRALDIPALVIHGEDDPLITIESGLDIAENIAKSWLLRVRGMGHDIPAELVGLFTHTIQANCARAPGGS